MSLTRANPFNRPSPFKTSSYENNYSAASYSPSPGIIQSQVKPISAGFTLLPNNRPSTYSHSSGAVGLGYRNYQDMGSEINKSSYLNTIIPTSDNMGAKQKNLYSYGPSYTTNLNMNSNYSLLQANNPLSKENPFNRPSLLGGNITATRTVIGHDDYGDFSRPSSNCNPLSNLHEIPEKYSNTSTNKYDHLSYKYKADGNFSTSRVGGMEKIQSSLNKYENRNLNLNTNYNLNSDKSDTASVRSYINKISDFEEGKEEYYPRQPSSTLNNPFNRKSLNPPTKANQNKYGDDYSPQKFAGTKDYSHLEYKGSNVENKQRKKYGYVDEQQLKYTSVFDKYKYKYEQQKKIEEENKNNMYKGKREDDINSHKDYQKHVYDYAKDILGDSKSNKEDQNRQLYKGIIENSIFNTLKSINPGKVPQAPKFRKPYQFEDYHQNEMDSQEQSQSQVSSKYRPYENPQNRGYVINNNNNTREIRSDPYKRYNFDKKQSYEYELQRVTLKQITKNNKQFDTNYADNFNNHGSHYQSPQFQHQKVDLENRKNQPAQLNQYQSPQFGSFNRRQPEINSFPKRDVSSHDNNRMPDNNQGNKNIIRFDQDHNDEESYDELSNHEKQVPTNEQRKKQPGQYSSNFVFRNQPFYRLQMV